MQKIDNDELKKLQFNILCATHDFCVKNGINYWLDCGTLLGAIRHNGYIPWDDDIDIGMLRDDYDRFCRFFNEQNDRYQLKCIEQDKNYCVAFGKVFDTETVLYEPDKNGRKMAVNIDVFVYDNAPDNDTLLTKMYRTRDFYRGCNTARTQRPDHEPGVIRYLCFIILHIVLKIFPRNFFASKMMENSKKYNNTETKRVGNFTSYSKIACNKTIFSAFILHQFETKQFYIPVGYDKWLTAFYGDYMQLPPEEKRVSHHEFEAYYKLPV